MQLWIETLLLLSSKLLFPGPSGLSSSLFNGGNKKVTVGATLHYVSDVEDLDYDEFDDDVIDPDFVPNIANLQGKV